MSLIVLGARLTMQKSKKKMKKVEIVTFFIDSIPCKHTYEQEALVFHIGLSAEIFRSKKKSEFTDYKLIKDFDEMNKLCKIAIKGNEIPLKFLMGNEVIRKAYWFKMPTILNFRNLDCTSVIVVDLNFTSQFGTFIWKQMSYLPSPVAFAEWWKWNA